MPMLKIIRCFWRSPFFLQLLIRKLLFSAKQSRSFVYWSEQIPRSKRPILHFSGRWLCDNFWNRERSLFICLILRKYIDVISAVSVRSPDYATMVGKRFLLFLSKNEMESSSLTIDKPEPCVFNYYKYIINENDQLFFDGNVIDQDKKEVINTYLMKIDFNSVINVFSSSTIRKSRQPGMNAALLENITNYNLLGRQYSSARAPIAKLQTGNIIIRNSSDDKVKKIIQTGKWRSLRAPCFHQDHCLSQLYYIPAEE